MGDFNIARFSDEKIGGNSLCSQKLTTLTNVFSIVLYQTSKVQAARGLGIIKLWV